MNLQDTLYNWLSIKKVAEKRTTDKAAKDTCAFFEQILRDDHQADIVKVDKNNQHYCVTYSVKGKHGQQTFPVELIDALFLSIESEPKYNS
ncbi:hypothetical protein [Pseudalkalibacillus caeni]|uniref:Uncharacterized protein n=1 Tax=Exobacillus caeni TaxID=2574798 RepID=A0A5R9F5C6_9BACL|nr:hypothetical protein [Pseudalkalibacillus caeni]TLS37679.1 hypothetical protein FCL54_07590 [Pseudalkalibacillus caeni]